MSVSFLTTFLCNHYIHTHIYIYNNTLTLKQKTKMEVISPFHFDTPITAPSSPRSLGAAFFYSAPSSPSAFCRQDSRGGGGCSPSSAVPFYWEQKPGTPKEEYFSSIEDGGFIKGPDFEFDSSGNSDRCSLSADELFDGGKIRTLAPPPGFHYRQRKPSGSPKSPRSPAKLIADVFSPRHRKIDFDPFAAALEETRKSNSSFSTLIDNGSTHKGTKSSSPFRVSDLLYNEKLAEKHRNPANSPKASLSSASSFSSIWQKRWKIKELLLFRNASESWATDRNNQMKKKGSFLNQDEFTESSFSSTASGESESSRRISVPPISAHEFHYSVKRTVLEEMRKRRSLFPQRQKILGCLGFHATVPEIHRSL